MGIEYYYQKYSSAIGDIFIVGDDLRIAMISFRDITTMKLDNTESMYYHNKMTRGIKNVMELLNRYFNKRELCSEIKIVLGGGTENINSNTFNSDSERIILLDVCGYTPMEIAVYRELLETGMGATISYLRLAEKAGIPRGARFVGNAMAKNRFPIIIPCHRVIKSDSSLGNYSGGVAMKKYLLSLPQFVFSKLE